MLFRSMLNNQIPDSCRKCYKEEASGVASKRLWETRYWMEEGIDIQELIRNTDNTGKIPNKISYLDLRLGHTCNLKCVMCSPHDSSRWLQDYDKLMKYTTSKEVKSQIEFNKNTFNNFWYQSSSFWEDLYDQIPNLKQIGRAHV